MNDPVLNRKLFRHQAQIIHNKIPKYYTGGAPQSPFTATGFGQSLKTLQAANPGMVNPAMLKMLLPWGKGKKIKQGAEYAYKTYKAARAATKASGKGGTLWGTVPFTKTGKGAASVYEKLSKPVSKHMLKYPKTYGYTKAGIGGAFTAGTLAGAIDATKKGDYGTAVIEAALLPFGGGMTAKGIQLAKKGLKSKTGIGAFIQKAGRKTKKFAQKGDKWTWPLLGIGGGTALYRGEFSEAEAAEAGGYTEIEQEQIWEILKTVAKDIENYTQEEIDKAIEIYEKSKTVESSPDKSPGHPSNIGTEEMLSDEIVPDAGGSTSGESSEILAKQKEMNAQTQADVLKNKFDNADRATQSEFLKFRQSITDLTGTYGNDRDLILMKMASGMMSGQTAQKGLKGFLDVTGKAMGPTVDTALALSNAQKGRDTDLATAFLKMKGKQAEAAAEAAAGGGMTMKGKQERFIVKDEKSPYGYKVLLGQYNKETGQIMEAMGDGQYRVMPGNPTAIVVSQAQLQKSRLRVSSAAQAHEMAAWVEKYMDDNLKGLPGNVKLKLADWFSLSDNITSNSNKYTQGLDTQTYINVEVFDPANLSDELVGLPGFKRTEGDLIKEQYYDEQRRIQKDMAEMVDDEGWDVNDAQLAQLTKAALIENRLKYLVANANKQADRLTRYDINNAEKSTSVLPFINLSTGFMPRQVNEKMRALQDEMRATFDRSAKQYQQLGGTNDYLYDFVSIPYIREVLDLQAQKEMDHATVLDILETIEIPGVGV